MDKSIKSSSWVVFLLSFSLSMERAREIEGDLIEEAQAKGMAWYRLQSMSTAGHLFLSSCRKAPFLTFLLGLASLAASSILTTFLLFPMVFQLSSFSLLSSVLVIIIFRGLACFTVGVVLVDYANLQGLRASLMTAVLMLLGLVFHIGLQQTWGEFGDVFLGTLLIDTNFFELVALIIFYSLFSAISIVIGSVYSLKNKHIGKVQLC